MSTSRQKPVVTIIGAGLSGSEAAHFLAEKGVPVRIIEMRPEKLTPAHKTGGCAELVCSNSFKSLDETSAPGWLKREMTSLGSLILDSARANQVPAGQALGVDRDRFSEYVSQRLKAHPLIEFENREATDIVPGELTLIATGPLTSDPLADFIASITGEKDLYFYDAIAPIVDADSIDRDNVFLANRYGKGDEEAYLNCPMTREEYYAFIDELMKAETVPPKNFEKEIFFQGCQPIEAIAATGKETLRFGPLKPVGLDDPKTGRRPYAVLQLRPENKSLTAYNLVGFQTKLKWGEQSRLFKMIPALRNAEYFRMGSIHRNTYVCSPRVLARDLSLKARPEVFMSGQVTGVEGYLESSACGILAALSILDRIQGREFQPPPKTTALGALHHFITESNPKHFSPMNACFALFEKDWFPTAIGLKKDESRKKMVEQSTQDFSAWRESVK